MPALVNRSVGSSCGTTGEEGTKVCAWRCTKKSMNCRRTSVEVGAEVGEVADIENAAPVMTERRIVAGRMANTKGDGSCGGMQVLRELMGRRGGKQSGSTVPLCWGADLFNKVE